MEKTLKSDVGSGAFGILTGAFFYLYLFLTLFDAFGMLKCSSITLSLKKDNFKSVYVHAVSICDCDEIPGQ